MQLSTSQSSSETNLAALLLGGICPASQAGGMTSTATAPGGLDFSQLLPEAGAEPPVAPQAQPGAGTALFVSGAVPSLPVLTASLTVATDVSLPNGVSSPLPAEEASEPVPAAIDGQRPVVTPRQQGKSRASAADVLPSESSKPMRKAATSGSDRPVAISPEGAPPFTPVPAPSELLSFEFEPTEASGPELSECNVDEASQFPLGSKFTGQHMAGFSARTISEPVAKNTPSPASFRFAAPVATDVPEMESQETDVSLETKAPVTGMPLQDAAGIPVSAPAARPEFALPLPRFSFRPELSPRAESSAARVGEMPPTMSDPVENTAETGVTFPPEMMPRQEIPSAAAAMPATTAISRVSTSAGETANIAVRLEKDPAEKSGTVSGSGKSFLNASGKRVTSYPTNLGIGVAETASTMSAALLSPRASSPTAVADVPVAIGVESGKSIPDFAAPAEVVASTAQRAVEEVLQVAERVLSRDQSSVNIQFSIGGQDLTVRVEMRANEVHAIFRTDSAELRAALSQEWQNVTNQGGDRSLRMAPPVFASADSNAFSSSSGDTASQQRDSGAQRTGHEFAPAMSARTASSSSAASAPLAPAPRVWNRNSLHLHTLA